MNVLLTGHEGFIGKRLLEKLRTLDHKVDGTRRELFDNALCDELLDCRVERADIIFHVGAISDTSSQDMEEMMRYNYSASKKIFDLAQKYNKKVIYSSSAACGWGGNTPSNIYGWSKLLAEEYGMARCDEFVSLRYFNVYGPGEEHKGNMASVAYQAWGEDFFRLFPTEPQRDFVYIDDVIEANLHAVTAKKGVYEVGYGEARTFESLLEGMEVDYRYHKLDKVPSWYQFYTCADRDKRLLGWTPKFNVELGTAKYKEYLNEISSNRRQLHGHI